MAPEAADPAVLTRALTAAVDAARAQQRGGFEEAVAALARFDAEQFRSILGWLLRSALEELHPDGLDADDLREVVLRVGAASGWWPELEPQLLVVVLTGAFGEHPEPGDLPRTAHEVVAAHSVLVVADLVAATRGPLARHLASALAEVRRAETVEMP